MKKIFITLALGAAALTMPAYNVITVTPGRQPTSELRGRNDLKDAAISRAGDTHTVTVKLDYDPEKIQDFTFITIFNKTFSGGDYMFAPEGTFQIPEGTYTLLAQFTNKSVGNALGMPEMPSYINVVREDVKIDKDITLTFNPAEATERIRFQSLLPDGRKCVFGKTDSEGIPDFTGADATSCDLFPMILHEDLPSHGLISIVTGAFFAEVDEQRFDFAINPVSDRFHFVQQRLIFKNDAENPGAWAMNFGTRGSGDKLIVNNPAEYHTFTIPEIGRSDVFGTCKIERHPAVGQINACAFGDISMMSFNMSDDVLWKSIDFCGDTRVEMNGFSTSMLVGYTQIDRDETVEEDGWQTTYFAGISTPQIAMVGGQVRYVNYGIAALLVTPDAVSAAWPGHPAFSCNPAGETLIKIGNTVPVAVVPPTDYGTPGNPSLSLYPTYLGRLGEERGIDKNMYKREINDDKTHYLFKNDNILVDDMHGSNITEISVAQSASDVFPPTLTALMTRDAEGRVSDRFMTNPGAELHIAGGDFTNCRDDNRNSWFEYSPAELKVEYSPYRADDWASLEAVEDESMLSLPAFGAFWRVSLGGVDRTSANHWYDLRLTITDAAGNYQRQTISPAFRIEELSGIDAVGAESRAAEVIARYTLQGIRTDNPAPGTVCIERLADGTARKRLQ